MAYRILEVRSLVCLQNPESFLFVDLPILLYTLTNIPRHALCISPSDLPTALCCLKFTLSLCDLMGVFPSNWPYTRLPHYFYYRWSPTPCHPYDHIHVPCPYLDLLFFLLLMLSCPTPGFPEPTFSFTIRCSS
ncbi:hypothetical protein MPTK1_3g23430 [Marchantia polymorpha subsp. ruderalis]